MTQMTPYRNTNGNSGITHYAIGDAHIDIQFQNGGIYRYEETNIGRLNFLNMKAAAIIGNGLNSFINHFVRNRAIRIRH